MQTAYKTIYQRKFEEGVEQGLEKGLEQGERKALQRQLLRRFGDITPYLQKRLDNATLTQLEQWLDNFVTAETLEQVFQ